MRKINYPLIVSDFDGTLAKNDGTVSEANKKAIEKYVAAGGKFVLSTGRLPYGTRHIVKALHLQEVLCCGQGAVVVDLQSGKPLFSGAIDNDVSVAICQKMEQLHLHIHVYDLWEYHCNMDDLPLKIYEKAVGGVKANLVLDRPISQFVKERGICAIKVLAMVEAERAEEVIEALSAMHFKNCTVVKSSANLVEVVSTTFSKGTALEFLSKHYNIPLERTVAIGDQRNDIPMIEKAGLGFAVRNADEKLKEAGIVCEYTNEEDAVAKIIEKYGYTEE